MLSVKRPMFLRYLSEKGKYKFRDRKDGNVGNKASKGKYRNEGKPFEEFISTNTDNVKLMGEMIALQTLRTLKKCVWKIADIILV